MNALVRLLVALSAAPALPGARCAAPAPATDAGRAAGHRRRPRRTDDPDLDPNRAQPDFTLVDLPTTLRLPRDKLRVPRHAPLRPAARRRATSAICSRTSSASTRARRSASSFASGCSAARRCGIHRTSDRTIQFFGQDQVLRASRRFPRRPRASWASMDGTDNFSDSYSPALGVIVSRELGDHGALYAEPIWVNNTNPIPRNWSTTTTRSSLGLGARLRIRPHTSTSSRGVAAASPATSRATR